MAVPFLDNVDLQNNELQNAVMQNLATAPASPKEGRAFYDSNTGVKTLKFWNGSGWVVVDATKLSGALPLSALVNIANATLLGNNAGASGAPLALTPTQVKALLGIAAGDVSGLTATIQAVRLDQMALPTAPVAFNGQRATGVADPTSAQDAATKAYVDAQAQGSASGIDPKEAVRAATTANITLSGTQTLDGVTLAAGDRVLVKNQTTASDNGIYVVAAGAWTRSADASGSNLTNGAMTLSTEGTVNAGTQWYLQTADPITVGTTSLTWTQFGAGGTYTADASGGLQLTGSAFALKPKSGGGLVTDASGAAVDGTVPRKYAVPIGDGASASITVTHNLGTRDVHVTLTNAASPYDIQYATVQAATINTVTLLFATAPATNSLRCTVIG